jgi:hypothetical protein
MPSSVSILSKPRALARGVEGLIFSAGIIQQLSLITFTHQRVTAETKPPAYGRQVAARNEK